MYSKNITCALVPQCVHDTLLSEVHNAKGVVLATAEQLMPTCTRVSDTSGGVDHECFERLCEK